MSNVRVAVRVRPLTKREEEQGAKIVVAVEGDNVRVTNLKVPSYQEHDSRARLRQFVFDFCYWSAEANSRLFASQQMIYEDLGTKVLDAVFEGFNACVLAYGQSGSGKTYTMMGYNGDLGLTPRICQGLFDRMAQVKDKRITFRTEVSFLEIYNERVGDLLRTVPCRRQKHALRVREHPKLGPCVQDLSKHVVTDFNAVQALIERGIQNRSVAATKMHDHSSRSHAIFTISFTQARVDEELPSEVVSKIHLVDLAGSERATVHMSKIRLKEGANINKSLVALGGVICALAEKSTSQWSLDSMGSSRSPTSSTGESLSVPSSPMGSPSRGQQPFVPYRDSVLTWLLKDSLGGNSKTIMVATISPASTAYNETISTLRYIQRAKRIVNKPIINEDPNVKLIRELRAEIARLREMLSNAQKAGLLEQPTESNMPVAEIIIRNQDKAQELTRSWIEKWHYFQKQVQELSCKTCIHRNNLGNFGDCGTPYLVGVSDLPSTGVHIFYLKEGEMIIGNGNENGNAPDIILLGEKVASKHCRLNVEEGTTTITPINGTVCFLNGNFLSTPAKLNQGDVVQLGNNNTLRFVDPSQCMNMILKGNYNCSNALDNAGRFSGQAIINEQSLQILQSKAGMPSEDLQTKILAKCSDLQVLESFNKMLEMEFHQSVAQCSVCSQLCEWTAPQLKHSSDDSVMGDTEGSSNNDTNNPDQASDNDMPCEDGPNNPESNDKDEVQEYDDWSDADDFSYFAFDDSTAPADLSDEIYVENSERETYSRSIDYLPLPMQSLISRRLSPIQECPSTRTPSPATNQMHPAEAINVTNIQAKPETSPTFQLQTSEIKRTISCDSLDTDSLDDLEESPAKSDLTEPTRCIFPVQPSDESTDTLEIPSTLSESISDAIPPVPKVITQYPRRLNPGHRSTSSSEGEREFWQVRQTKPHISGYRNGSSRSLNRDVYTSSSEDESYQIQLGKPRTKSFKSTQRFEQIVLENKRKKRRKTATKKKPKSMGYPPTQISSVPKQRPDQCLSPPPLPKLDFGDKSTKDTSSQTKSNVLENADFNLFQSGLQSGSDASVRSDVCRDPNPNQYFSLTYASELNKIVPSNTKDVQDESHAETYNTLVEETHDKELPNEQLHQDLDTVHETFELSPLDCSDFAFETALCNRENFAECGLPASHGFKLYDEELDQVLDGTYNGTECSDFIFEPHCRDPDDSPDAGLSPQGSSERSELTCWSTIATAGQLDPSDQLHINVHSKTREKGLFESNSSLWGQSWPSCDSLTMVYMGPEWGSTETNMIASIHSLEDLDSDFSEGRQEALERFVAKSMKARQDSPQKFRNAFVFSSDSIQPYDGPYRNSNETFTICSTDDPMTAIWERKSAEVAIANEPIVAGQMEVNWTNDARPYKDLWTIHSYSMDDLQSHTSCLCKGLHDDAGNTSTGSTCTAEVSTQTESDSGIQTDATVQSDATHRTASTQSAEPCTNATCQTEPVKTEVHIQTDPVCTDTGSQTNASVSDGSTQCGLMENKSTQSVHCCKDAGHQTERNYTDAKTNTELKVNLTAGTQTDLFCEHEAQTVIKDLEKVTTGYLQQNSGNVMALELPGQEENLASKISLSEENIGEFARSTILVPVLETVSLPNVKFTTEAVLSGGNSHQDSGPKTEPVLLDKEDPQEILLSGEKPILETSVESENSTPENSLRDATKTSDRITHDSVSTENLVLETTEKLTSETSSINGKSSSKKVQTVGKFVQVEMPMNGKLVTRTVLSYEKIEPEKISSELLLADEKLMQETAMSSEKLAPENVNLIPETEVTEEKIASKAFVQNREAATEKILLNERLVPKDGKQIQPDSKSSIHQVGNGNSSTVSVPMCESGIYIGFHGNAHLMHNLDMKISFNDATSSLLEFNGKITEEKNQENTSGSECPVKIQSEQTIVAEDNERTESRISEHTKELFLAEELFAANNSDERFETEDNISTCTCNIHNSLPEMHKFWTEHSQDIKIDCNQISSEILENGAGAISLDSNVEPENICFCIEHNQRTDPPIENFQHKSSQEQADAENRLLIQSDKIDFLEPVKGDQIPNMLKPCEREALLWHKPNIYFEDSLMEYLDGKFKVLENAAKTSELGFKELLLYFSGHREAAGSPNANDEGLTRAQSLNGICKDFKCKNRWKCDKQLLESAARLSPVEVKFNIFQEQNQSEISGSIGNSETSEEEYYKLPLVIASKERTKPNKCNIPKRGEKNWARSANILTRETPKKKCHKSKLRESVPVPNPKGFLQASAKNKLVLEVTTEQKPVYDANFEPNKNTNETSSGIMGMQEKLSSAEVRDSKNDIQLKNKCKHNVTCTCDLQEQLPAPVSKLNSDTEHGENLPDDIIQLLRECRAVRKKAWKEIALAHQQLSITSSSQKQQTCAIHQIKSFEGS